MGHPNNELVDEQAVTDRPGDRLGGGVGRNAGDEHVGVLVPQVLLPNAATHGR
jgi:hypothetical protein